MPRGRRRKLSEHVQDKPELVQALAAIDTAREAYDIRWTDKNKRLDRIDALVADGWSTNQIVRALVAEFGVAQRTVYTDVVEAEARRAPVRALEAKTLKEQAAAKWERRQYICEQLGEQREANQALDRWCKVMGAYAPTKVEVSTSVDVSVRIASVVKVLDAEGLAALKVVQAQIARAKAAGLLESGTDVAPSPTSGEREPS